MKIETTELKIPFVSTISLDLISEFFVANNLNVIRWAVVDTNKEDLILNITHLK